MNWSDILVNVDRTEQKQKLRKQNTDEARFQHIVLRKEGKIRVKFVLIFSFAHTLKYLDLE